MSLGIIVLAAGDSSRMGKPKQLLDYHGKTLLRHAAKTACAVPGARVAVALGANATRLREELANLPVLIFENERWIEGMGTTLSHTLESLRAAQPDLSEVIVMLCDQPFVTPEILGALIEGHRRTGQQIVAAQYRNVSGVPALFARSLLDDLQTLAGDEGARRLMLQHQEMVLGIPFSDGAIDIDTPEDYANLARSPSSFS